MFRIKMRLIRVPHKYLGKYFYYKLNTEIFKIVDISECGKKFTAAFVISNKHITVGYSTNNYLSNFEDGTYTFIEEPVFHNLRDYNILKNYIYVQNKNKD